MKVKTKKFSRKKISKLASWSKKDMVLHRVLTVMENLGKINFHGSPGKVMENSQKVKSHGKKVKSCQKFLPKDVLKIIPLFERHSQVNVFERFFALASRPSQL